MGLFKHKVHDLYRKWLPTYAVAEDGTYKPIVVEPRGGISVPTIEDRSWRHVNFSWPSNTRYALLLPRRSIRADLLEGLFALTSAPGCHDPQSVFEELAVNALRRDPATAWAMTFLGDWADLIPLRDDPPRRREVFQRLSMAFLDRWNRPL